MITSNDRFDSSHCTRLSDSGVSRGLALFLLICLTFDMFHEIVGLDTRTHSDLCCSQMLWVPFFVFSIPLPTQKFQKQKIGRHFSSLSLSLPSPSSHHSLYFIAKHNLYPSCLLFWHGLLKLKTVCL